MFPSTTLEKKLKYLSGTGCTKNKIYFENRYQKKYFKFVIFVCFVQKKKPPKNVFNYLKKTNKKNETLRLKINQQVS